MHKEKEEDCKFFVVQGSSSAVLGMPDIDNLGILTINCETIGRQVTPDENAGNSKRNRQHERTIQTEGGKFESYENKRQDAEAKSQHNADNTLQSSIVTNPMVISNTCNENSFSAETINKDSNSILSELIINENQSSVLGPLRKDDMVAANAKQTSKKHTNGNESFISDIYKDPVLEMQTAQRRRNENRRKGNISKN